MPPSPGILVLYAHPTPHQSQVNHRLAQAAARLPNVTVHDLYETYPDFAIDVAREQALVEQADVLVFLHPIYWYSMPSLLKEWVDAVLQPGWAYGKDGTALRGKHYWLVVTTGSAAEDYRPGAAHDRPFADFLAPFEQTAALCGMRWVTPQVLHAARATTAAAVEAHIAAFVARLADFSPDQASAQASDDHGT
ncbi:glutathione-regulated potassium-efflux system oxidoreductase KefF [Massilia glaciei]|uniref:NAD(P)H dehydrogenase n=1 Tax=Massilia glaciei TaxID=1524097 RepID=A0A2U2HF90_9BURK|nr:NAD(P)H-dependent oxidoreductase [Massilia glaciei]PWF42872.1 NAD(P)H dehydrogenase [Massilia glaciei]